MWQPAETAPKDGTRIVVLGHIMREPGEIDRERLYACVSAYHSNRRDSPAYIEGWYFSVAGVHDGDRAGALGALAERNLVTEERRMTPPRDDLVAQVARAIGVHLETDYDRLPWASECYRFDQRALRRVARAAIKAVREADRQR